MPVELFTYKTMSEAAVALEPDDQVFRHKEAAPADAIGTVASVKIAMKTISETCCQPATANKNET
jgi:hypothetical protein